MRATAASPALLLAALAAAPGCSLFDSTVRLAWPPPGETTAPEPPPSAPAVSLQPLEDRRAGSDGALGTAGFLELRTPDDVSAWATAALCDELHLKPGDTLLVEPRELDGEKVWFIKPAGGGRPAWFGRLRKYAVGKAHDLAAIRASIAKGRKHEPD